MTLEEHKTALREHSRYPYTYACDWLRMKGLAQSRSDAAQLINGRDEAVILAEQYVTYFSLLNMADEFLNEVK